MIVGLTIAGLEMLERHGHTISHLQVKCMVALSCFCCDHFNPAGAKFCNACGTPLHLKPCKHCEAINSRAAAHCHQCGETFACVFPTPLAVAPMPDESDAVEGQAGVYAIDSPSQPLRRGIRTRVAAVLLGLTATVMLSAYYAYRQSGSGLVTGAMVERPLPAAPTMEPVLPSEAAPAPVSVPSDLAASGASPDRPGSNRGGAETVAGVAFNGTSPGKILAARARAVNNAGARKPKAERVTPSSRTETFATIPPALHRVVGVRSLPDRDRIAVQQTVATSQPRMAPANPAPAQRPRQAARRPAVATGGWDRPCAEGVALESTCDVRMMPKGN